MPCCKTEVPKNGAMKKQGIGRNADALLSKNLSRKIPLPQSLFAQKALCQKPFGNRSHRADPVRFLRSEPPARSGWSVCSALLRRLTARPEGPEVQLPHLLRHGVRSCSQSIWGQPRLSHIAPKSTTFMHLGLPSPSAMSLAGTAMVRNTFSMASTQPSG